MQDNLCGPILYSSSHIDMKCSSNKNNECILVSNNGDSCLMNDTLDSICKTIQNLFCKDIYGLGNAKNGYLLHYTCRQWRYSYHDGFIAH